MEVWIRKLCFLEASQYEGLTAGELLGALNAFDGSPLRIFEAIEDPV